ncbi:hypothetical protein GQR58_011480 [Nymphon striatum]|nr:hypothetical protein GQR58_011480 [Nymphon striatum]
MYLNGETINYTKLPYDNSATSNNSSTLSWARSKMDATTKNKSNFFTKVKRKKSNNSGTDSNNNVSLTSELISDSESGVEPENVESQDSQAGAGPRKWTVSVQQNHDKVCSLSYL